MFRRPENSSYPDYFEKGHTDFPEWWYYGRYNKELDRYKLHICIHPHAFEKVRDDIHNLLHTSISQGVVALYKTYSVEDAKDSKGKERQRNSPFVIYLNNNYDDSYLYKITQLCEKIENLLSDVPSGEERRRADCDLYLSSHIIFRQTMLEGETTYIPALDKARADLLRTQGENSFPYKKISFNLEKIRALNEDFSNKVGSLIEIMEPYKKQLEIEKSRLTTEHGENNEKVKILISKISRMEKEIKRIENEEKHVLQKGSFDNEQEMQLARNELLSKFKEDVKIAMKFSDAARELLFLNKSTIRNLVGIESTTKSHLKDITDPMNINEKVDNAYPTKPSEILPKVENTTLKKVR